ncbi:oligopeptide ABC transporter substrate-binding protein [Granulicatella sp. zg-ZJ]|uniref:oligopeptide ABC transporter substrate-binding protein n=1 Tax=Granulicatella sp. zg-ZJ TaxID=2678504 RepID=UPI0013D5493B|nr:oligopeptide ABC transporter substrate-binding protein [Granulicatella sp. zg-ZJ]NEW62831.1 oligopeptide ABC transporter substrate-binding protein [Granulicatella sp. zg-ZJ]
MAKKAKWFLGLASVAVLAACGNNTDTAKEETKSADSNVAETLAKFPSKIEHEGTPIKGGVLKYALISDSPIPGVFSGLYQKEASDSEVTAFTEEGLFIANSDYKIVEGGLGTLAIDKDAKTITIKVKENVKWSDGEPFTIDDYIYAFEVIGHKDYKGERYNDTFKNIVGMDEYHEGKSETISGIKKNDDHSVTFQLKEVSPSLNHVGGFWSTPFPKHQLKDIAIKDQSASDAVRKNPAGLGAFKFKKIVTGESVELEANPYYWKGQPNLDGVIIEVVNSTNSPDEFKAGKYDIMSVSTLTAIYDSFKELNNATLAGKWRHAYQYIGFKFGKWDAEKETSVITNEKINDKALRQAMGYALNLEEIGQTFYNGLRVRANSMLAPTFGSLHDSTLPGFPHDPEKAKKILDEAGYKDKDGDGLRENPKGEKLTINLAMSAGGDNEPISQAYIKYWKEVGLDVQLVGGRLIEGNSFFDRLENDDPEVDLFVAGWSLSGDPNQSHTWGNTQLNMTRYVSEKNDELLAKMGSAEAFDSKKQKEIFDAWQKYANEEAFGLPLFNILSLTAVNTRVKNLDVKDYEGNWGYNLHKIQLTADAPAASK